MRTTKRTIIELDHGDEIEIRAGGKSFIVSVDTDRHDVAPIIDLTQGAETAILKMDYDICEENAGIMREVETEYEVALARNTSIFI